MLSIKAKEITIETRSINYFLDGSFQDNLPRCFEFSAVCIVSPELVESFTIAYKNCERVIVDHPLLKQAFIGIIKEIKSIDFILYEIVVAGWYEQKEGWL